MEFFKIKDDFAVIELNPRLYDLEAIYSAAYQTMEDSYIYFEGDPEIEITVNISYKDKSKNDKEALSLLAKNFMNQLVNYTYYKINSKKKEILRALLLKKSFDNINLYDTEADSSKNIQKETDISEEDEDVFDTDDFEDDEEIDATINKDDEELDDDFEFDDPEGIAIPWEEKYGDKKEGEIHGD
ncbi:MAG: hypothetical protein ACLFPQ_05715 [Candidatus Woesearchaeota archaeon]